MLRLPSDESDRAPSFSRLRRTAVCVFAAGAAFCGPLVLSGCGGGAGAAGAIPARMATASVLPSSRTGAKTVKLRDISAGYDTTVLNDAPLAFYRMNDTTSTLTD